MDTQNLLETAIGPDAHAALKAANSLKDRGRLEVQRALHHEWSTCPVQEVTENFLRDVFQDFGEVFAAHLVSLLKAGGVPAAQVAAYAFPPGLPGNQLFSFAEFRVENQRLTPRLTLLSVGSAGLVQFAGEIVRNTNEKWSNAAAAALVRLFVQTDSSSGARAMLRALSDFAQRAHDQLWPNPRALLHDQLPNWRLTSPAVDVLVEDGLAADLPEEVRAFASDTLAFSEERRVARALIRRVEQGYSTRPAVVPILAHLGGPDAARFVSQGEATAREKALVLPWAAPDGSASETLSENKEARFLVARALGIVGKRIDLIEEILGSTHYVERGYAGLGLAYARGSEAQSVLLRSIEAVSGDGPEQRMERLYLNTALVIAGDRERSGEILKGLTAYGDLRSSMYGLKGDLAKQDIMLALSLALGEDNPAVRAWRRVACAPAYNDPTPPKLARGKPSVPTSQGGSVKKTKKPVVDVAVLTIKVEEFRAALEVFPPRGRPWIGKSKRHYNLATADAGEGQTYCVALARHTKQGSGEAQKITHAVIADLNPSLILVVGIGGAKPDSDFTLGDVVVADQINDYTVEAKKVEAKSEFAMAGGPLSDEIRALVANLDARIGDMGDWTSGLPGFPVVELDKDGNFKGPDHWKAKVRASLQSHFEDRPKRPPIFIQGAIGSSDKLIREPSILIAWLETARNLLAVEMEAAGIYQVEKVRNRLILIRGISDIVGFERDEAWTLYACKSAAAFARAFLKTHPVPVASGQHPPTEQHHDN